MTNEEFADLGRSIVAYAEKFNVPLPYLLEILEDQKVTPMIRGKAMEYNAYLLLEDLLPKNVWSVQKLNLNAQPGTYDEDISITHRRTGIILKVESKSAVRGSFTDNKRARKKELRNIPGFKVKSHRSRSNMELAETSNDRYHVSSFDILITNVSNAIFQGATVGESLEILHNATLKGMLLEFYNVTTDEGLRKATESDWRFCIPTDIAENDFIPRTPFVLLEDDPHWKSLDYLQDRLIEVVSAKRHVQTASRR